MARGRLNLTELERIDYLTNEVKRHYSNIIIYFNHKKKRFQVVEKVTQGAAPLYRRLWDYENTDGTRLPANAQRIVDWLHRANTRHWPLELRMAAFDEEEKREKEALEKNMKAYVADRVLEDYHYIAGIPTFFFGPDMPVKRATFTPAQERILKNAHII